MRPITSPGTCWLSMVAGWSNRALYFNSKRDRAMSIFTSEQKQVSLAEAATIVQDGMTIAVGGGLSLREPVAFLRGLIRQGPRDPPRIGTAPGGDVDPLCCAGTICVTEESYVWFEDDS